MRLIFVNCCSKTTSSNDTAPIGSGEGPNNVNYTSNPIPNPNHPGPNPPGPNQIPPGGNTNGPKDNDKSLDYWPGAIGDCSGLNGTGHFNGTIAWRGIKGPNSEVYSCMNDQYILVEQTSHPTHQYETNTYKVTVQQTKFRCEDDSKQYTNVGEVPGTASLKEFFKTGDTFTCVASIPFFNNKRDMICNGTVTGVCLRLWCPKNQVAGNGGFAKYVRTETIPGGFDNAPKSVREDVLKLGFRFAGMPYDPDCAWMHHDDDPSNDG